VTAEPEMAPRVRRERGAQESLLAIALGLEAAVVFFATLVAFGLRVVDPVPAFVGGGVLLLLLVLVAGIQRHRAGVVAGGVLQILLILTGLLLPAMWVLGGGFAALWLWSLIRGRQLDRAKAEALASLADAPTPSPTEGDPA